MLFYIVQFFTVGLDKLIIFIYVYMFVGGINPGSSYKKVMAEGSVASRENSSNNKTKISL